LHTQLTGIFTMHPVRSQRAYCHLNVYANRRNSRRLYRKHR